MPSHASAFGRIGLLPLLVIAGACRLQTCSSLESRSSKAAPAALAATVKGHGPGLPASLPAASYEQILAATRVTVQGTLATSTGPLIVRAASLGDSSLQLRFVLAAIPNLDPTADGTGGSARLEVARVLDVSGVDVLDRSATWEADQRLIWWAEATAGGITAPGRYESKMQTLDLPGVRTAPAYATCTLSLARALPLRDIARIDGTVRLRLPTDVTLVASRTLAEIVERPGLTLRFARKGKRRVVIEARGEIDRVVASRARDAAVTWLENASCSETDAEPAGEASRTKTIDCTYLTTSEVQSVDVALAGGWLEKSYPFSLKR